MDISIQSETGQLAISLDLLLLLRWLVQNEPTAIERLVQNAVKSGLGDQLTNHKNPRTFDDVVDQVDLHLCVADFFSLLESALHKNALLTEELALTGNPVMPTVSKIDLHNCDNETIALSVAKATTALKKDAKKDIQETLYKELLKNWHPRTQIH